MLGLLLFNPFVFLSRKVIVLFLSAKPEVQTKVESYEKLQMTNLRKQEGPNLKSSSEHSPTVFLEDALLLVASAQHIKIPSEDRSKYEQLITQSDHSSENSSNDEIGHIIPNRTERIRKRRKIRNISETLQAVCKSKEIPQMKSFTLERSGNMKDVASKQEHDVNVETDGSIGSASDLHVFDDTADRPCNESDDNINKVVTESLKTCGSSAYFAESESIMTLEDDKAKWNEEATQRNIIFGRQYGEKPLLLDDELDSDSGLKENKTATWARERSKYDLWIQPSSSCEDDSFAMAPFGKEKSKMGTAAESAGVLNVSGYDSSSCLNPFLETDDHTKITEKSVIRTEIPTTLGFNYFEEVHLSVNFPAVTVTNHTLHDKSKSNEDNLVDSSYNTYKEPNAYFFTHTQFSDDEFKKTDNFQNTPFRSSKANANSALMNVRSSTPEIKYKTKNNKKKEKLKYNLIEDRTTDEDFSKIGTGVKGTNVYKKVSSKSIKKNYNSKTKPQEGFNNMSFEDFPSDDAEIDAAMATPFEVLRNPEHEESRYANLK